MQLPNVQASTPPDSARKVAELIERDQRVLTRSGPFEFWYRWTAPRWQPLTASFEEREIVRQGRLTSTVLAIVAGSLIILAVPTSIAIHNPTLLVVLCVLLTIVSFALILNRIGKGFGGRILVVVAMNVSLAISVLTTPGGLGANTLPNFDIMVVEPTFVALALLPPASAFLVALANAAFIGCAFYFLPHAADLALIMHSNAYGVVTRPLYLLIFVVGIGYPVMRSVLRAIALGDRAKEIAKVQHDLAEREAFEASGKRLLDQGVQSIVAWTAQVANGDLSVRAPLPDDRSLWPLSGSLNVLLARFKRASQSEAELRRVEQAAMDLVSAIQRSQQTQRPLQMPQRRSAITDPILMELLKHSQRSHSPLNNLADFEREDGHKNDK